MADPEKQRLPDKATPDTAEEEEYIHDEHADSELSIVSEPTEDSVQTRPPLEKQQSKASVNNVAAIPNGGLRAWLQVLGAFCLFFNSWGVINTFGAYQTFYESGELFQSSSSNLSWVGGLQACLLLLVGALTGPLYDAGYFRPLLLSGCFLVVFGQMMLSLCESYYQVLLAQAVTIGLGAGCMFVPSVAIISTYFTTRISTAIGIAASGSSLGGVIYPIVFHRLQPSIGFGWATRVIGFIMLATLALPIAVMRVRVLPSAKRKLFDASAWKEPAYVLYVVGSFIGFMGLYIPFFYIQFYAIRTGITGSNIGFYLLAILNTASVLGRIVPNVVADRIGTFNMLIPCTWATSILIFALIGVRNEAGIVILALLYGFFSGTFVSLPPSIYVALSPTRGIIGTRMGMGFSVVAIGVLVGTPIAGAILGNADSPTAPLNWTGVWVFGGALTAGGGVLVTAARFYESGLVIMKKV